MWIGASQVGATPVGSSNPPLYGVQSPYYELLNLGLELEAVMLLEIDVYDPSIPGTRTVKYLWTNAPGREWRGKINDTDSYASQTTEPPFVRTVIFGADPFARRSRSESEVGTITLAIAEEDGWDFMGWHWGGAPLRIYLGRIEFGRSEFELFITARVNDVRFTSDKRVQIVIEAPGKEFDIDIQQNTYDGLGEAGGSESLRDHRKPLCWGDVLNAEPVLIDSVYNIYQVHDGRIDYVFPYDGGVPIDPSGPSGDFASFAALKAWEPAPGEFWAAALAVGMYRLRSRPGIQLTNDIRGDADVALGGYVASLADVAKRIILQRTTITEERIEGLLQVSSSTPYNVGVYLRDGAGSVHDVLDQLLHPHFVFELPLHNGQLRFGRLGGAFGYFDIPAHAVRDARRMSGVQRISTFRMRYRQSYVVQGEGSLATTADNARRALVGTQYREALEMYAGPVYADAVPYELTSSLVDESAARAEAQSQLAFMDDNPHIFEFDVDVGHFNRLLPGTRIKVTYSKLGLDMGRYFYVLSAQSNFKTKSVKLVAWGY